MRRELQSCREAKEKLAMEMAWVKGEVSRAAIASAEMVRALSAQVKEKGRRLAMAASSAVAAHLQLRGLRTKESVVFLST
jgi:uroporphyrinogen-III synthase